MNKMKRFVASLLVLMLVISMVPVTALAAEEDVTTYTVTFDAGNGQSPAVVEVNDGETVEKPEDPVYNLNIFEGWYTESDEEYDFATPVTADITLTAKWEMVSTVRIFVYVSESTTVAKADPEYFARKDGVTAQISLNEEYADEYEIVSIDSVGCNGEDITAQCTIDQNALTVAIPADCDGDGVFVYVTMEERTEEPVELESAGDIIRAWLRTNEDDTTRIMVDMVNVSYNESVALELYSGETLLTTATLNATEYPGPATKAELTGSICVTDTSDTWPNTAWTPLDNVVPTEIKLVVDGEIVDTYTEIYDANPDYGGKRLEKEAWNNVPGTTTLETVNVVIYRNGDTSTPYKTVSLGKMAKGTKLDLTTLNIGDYYASDYGFEFEGWFNDGGWNQYKAGKNPAGLSEITINGWTNICCMVTDYQKVIVKAVVNGDKDNAETIFTGKALKGENLVSWLDENAEVADRTGYKLDKWYNWDWYGHKFGEDVTVNGWTNVYVTYDAITYRIKYVGGEGSVYVGSEGSCKADQDWVIINGYTYDEPVTLNSGEYFSRPGRSVIGWTNGGTTYAVGETVEKNFTSVQNGMVTMTAVWSECEHIWDDGEVTTEATCTEDGVMTYTCTNGCGETKTESIPATEHDFTWKLVATTTVAKEATCETAAEYYYSCKKCEALGTETFIIGDPLGHDWDEGEVTTEATCTEDGVMTYTCTRGCTKTEAIPATEHDFTWKLVATTTVAKEATCDTAAEYYYSCKKCEALGTETFTIGDPLGHDWDDGEVTTEATCTEDGVMTYTCTRGCTKTEAIPATEHDFTWKLVATTTVAKEATCETAAEYYYSCKKCEALGTETFIIGDPLGHDWDEGEVTTEATCTEDGVMTYTCTRGCTKTEAIPATNHNYVDTVIDPTCCAGGYTMHKCSECGDTYYDNETEATGEHTYEDGCTAEKPVESVPATPVKPAVPSWVKFWNWMFSR